MTEALQQAIDQLQQMSDERQESIARLVLHEIEQDRLWAETTEKHAGKLGKLVADILADDQRGACEPLDADQL